MVLDTSALLAILLDEPERRAFNEAIEAAEERVMSVASLVEVSIVIEARFRAEGVRELDLFVDQAGIALVTVDLARPGYGTRVPLNDSEKPSGELTVKSRPLGVTVPWMVLPGRHELVPVTPVKASPLVTT
jgi:hypothetical protein